MWSKRLADRQGYYRRAGLTVKNASVSGAAAAFLDPVLSSFGATRIAWGSNLRAAEQTLPELVALATDVLSEASEADWTEIFAGTARRLYPTLDNHG